LQKIYNLYQDPYERADFTSNTYWDYVLNHVGSIYGVIGEIVSFAETFKAYPPRSIPPSFNPTTIMQETLREIKLDARYGQKQEPAKAQPKKK
jgi:arylsulfatase